MNKHYTNTSPHFVCVAAKSGGHILPCLTFARTHYHKNPRISFMSSTTALDKKIVSELPDISNTIFLNLMDVPYKKWWKFPLFFFSFIASFFTSFLYLKKNKPERIVSTGGLIALPICMAARCLGIPFDIIELNVVPGKATHAISRWSDNLFVCFTQAQHYFKKTSIVVPYPLRFTDTNCKITKKDFMQKYKLNENKKNLFILGGSQGSEFLNTFIKTLPISLLESFNIIHQTGFAAVESCATFYKTAGINHYVFAYQNDLTSFYTYADYTICRAGAGTLFELLFFKKQALIIPLETSVTDHQLDNAKAFQENHPAYFTFLRQNDLIKNPTIFITKIQKLAETNLAP